MSIWEKDHVFFGCQSFDNGQCVLIPSFLSFCFATNKLWLGCFLYGSIRFYGHFCEMFISVFPIMTLSVIKLYLLEEHNLHGQSFGGLDSSRPCLRFIFHHVGRWSGVEYIQFSFSSDDNNDRITSLLFGNLFVFKSFFFHFYLAVVSCQFLKIFSSFLFILRSDRKRTLCTESKWEKEAKCILFRSSDIYE